MHMLQLSPSKWTIGLSVLFFCLTLGIWISATIAFSEYSLQWTYTALLACAMHLISLAVFSVLPKHASYFIIIIFFIDCVFTDDYASIQQYGVFLALAYIAFSEPIRYSVVVLMSLVVACGICVWNGDMLSAQFFTSTTCHCLAYIAGLAIHVTAQDYTLRKNAEILRSQRMRDNIARNLHDAVTNELTSIILMCEAKGNDFTLNSRDMLVVKSQAEQALHNTQKAILTLHGVPSAFADGTDVDNNPFTLQEFISTQDKLLDAMGFHGTSTFLLHSRQFPPHIFIDDVISVIKEIYANIARHCPKDGLYQIRVDIDETSVCIEESNPFVESDAYRFSSGFGLKHIRTIATQFGGSCYTSIDNQRWTVRIYLRSQQ